MKFVKLWSLKIFSAEDVVCGDKPFYRCILEEAREQDIAGGTLIRAEEGYGTEIRGLDDTVRSIVFSGSYNLPVIVEIVDTYEKLSRIFPFLEEHGDLHFLAVIEMKHALFTKYIQENAARMHRENEVHLLDKPEGA